MKASAESSGASLGFLWLLHGSVLRTGLMVGKRPSLGGKRAAPRERPSLVATGQSF